MTQRWITWEEYEHLTETCPRSPIVKAIWQDAALYGNIIPEPNRYRLPANARRSPAHAGFYKLDTEKE